MTREPRASAGRRRKIRDPEAPPFNPDPDIVTYRERDLRPGEVIRFEAPRETKAAGRRHR